MTETSAYGAQSHLSLEDSSFSKSRSSATESAGIPKLEEVEASGKAAMLREKFSGSGAGLRGALPAMTVQNGRSGSKLGGSSHARIPQLRR